MPKKLGICLLIISIILIILLSTNLFFCSFKRIIKNYKATLTGDNIKLSIYSNDGKIINQILGKKTYLKYFDNSVEIHIDNKKYIFSNISLIIEEI